MNKVTKMMQTTDYSVNLSVTFTAATMSWQPN